MKIQELEMKIQSNGMGTQSTAMYYMSSMGMLPRFDFSIFVDTGAERKETYKGLQVMQAWAKKNNGVPIIVINQMNIKKDLLNIKNKRFRNYVFIPGYTTDDNGKTGMLRRQCTMEYKIRQIRAKIREIQGIGKGRFKPFENYLGITIDEAKRISEPGLKAETKVYPFCNIVSGKKIVKKEYLERAWDRADCINFLIEHNLFDPGKSSCYMCPFMNDREWIKQKQDPQVWPIIKEIDNAIRDSTKKGINNKMYLHKQCVPIDQVELKENQKSLFEGCDNEYCNI